MTTFSQSTNQRIIQKKDKRTQTLRSKAIKPSESKDLLKHPRRFMNISLEAKAQEEEWSTMKKWGSRIKWSTQISWLHEKLGSLRTELCITSLVLDKDNRFESEQKTEAMKRSTLNEHERTPYKKKGNEKSWLRKSWNIELTKYVKNKNCWRKKKKMRRKNVIIRNNWSRNRNKRTKSWKSSLSNGNKKDRRKSKKKWSRSKKERNKNKL